MTYENPLLKKFNLTGKPAGKKKGAIEPPVVNMMNDPAYLRQSSALIHEALQKGFDVLQLASGDIVTTGTKTVVYQYAWDAEKAKLVKTKTADSGARAKAARSKSAPLVEEEEEESEEA